PRLPLQGPRLKNGFDVEVEAPHRLDEADSSRRRGPDLAGRGEPRQVALDEQLGLGKVVDQVLLGMVCPSADVVNLDSVMCVLEHMLVSDDLEDRLPWFARESVGFD